MVQIDEVSEDIEEDRRAHFDLELLLVHKNQFVIDDLVFSLLYRFFPFHFDKTVSFEN